MADKDPSDVPPIPIPPLVDLTGNGDEQKPAPRKKAEPKAVPPAAVPPAAVPASTVPPIEAAPAAPEPAAQPNPYATAPAAPAAQPNPYAAPAAQPYAYGPYVPQPPKGLSITSMILGIAGAVLALCYGFGFLLGVGAVITGFLAKKSQPYAKGMWLTGIVTGFVTIGISLLWLLGIIVFAVWSGATGGGRYYNF